MAVRSLGSPLDWNDGIGDPGAMQAALSALASGGGALPFSMQSLIKQGLNTGLNQLGMPGLGQPPAPPPFDPNAGGGLMTPQPPNGGAPIGPGNAQYDALAKAAGQGPLITPQGPPTNSNDLVLNRPFNGPTTPTGDPGNVESNPRTAALGTGAPTPPPFNPQNINIDPHFGNPFSQPQTPTNQNPGLPGGAFTPYQAATVGGNYGYNPAQLGASSGPNVATQGNKYDYQSAMIDPSKIQGPAASSMSDSYGYSPAQLAQLTSGPAVTNQGNQYSYDPSKLGNTANSYQTKDVGAPPTPAEYAAALKTSFQPYFDDSQQQLAGNLAAMGILPSGAGTRQFEDLTAKNNATYASALQPLIQQGFGQQFSANQQNAGQQTAANQAVFQTNEQRAFADAQAANAAKSQGLGYQYGADASNANAANNSANLLFGTNNSRDMSNQSATNQEAAVSQQMKEQADAANMQAAQQAADMKFQAQQQALFADQSAINAEKAAAQGYKYSADASNTGYLNAGNMASFGANQQRSAADVAAQNRAMETGLGYNYGAAQTNAGAQNSAYAQALAGNITGGLNTQQNLYGASESNAQRQQAMDMFNQQQQQQNNQYNTGIQNQYNLAQMGYGNSNYQQVLQELAALNGQGLASQGQVLGQGMNNATNAYNAAGTAGAGYANKIGYNQGYGQPSNPYAPPGTQSYTDPYTYAGNGYDPTQLPPAPDGTGIVAPPSDPFAGVQIPGLAPPVISGGDGSTGGYA